MENWKKMLQIEFERNGDVMGSMVCTVSNEQLEKDFDSGYGGTNGCAFTAWGEKYVYFPICYDGSEWVGCAPRNPCDESMEHQGGG